MSPPKTQPTIAQLQQQVSDCRLCPRLVEWRETVAKEKVKRFQDWVYWGKAVPGVGDPHARLVIVGLAPAAHGANRTGRMFTGDRSGDWLYRALHKAGFASQAESTHKDDGLTLTDCYITAVVHCAPPLNKPTTEEVNTCRDTYLPQELTALTQWNTVMVLGSLAFHQTLKALSNLTIVPIDEETGEPLKKKPAFGHNLIIPLSQGKTMICSYHPSQQNTFTKRLTEPMLDAAFAHAKTHITP